MEEAQKMLKHTKLSIIIKKKKKKEGEREKIGKYGICNTCNIITLYNKHGLPKKILERKKHEKKRSREHVMLNQSLTTTTTLTIYVACLWLVLYRPTVYRIGCWGVTQTLQEIQHKTNSDTQVSVTTSPSKIFRTTPPSPFQKLAQKQNKNIKWTLPSIDNTYFLVQQFHILGRTKLLSRIVVFSMKVSCSLAKCPRTKGKTSTKKKVMNRNKEKRVKS